MTNKGRRTVVRLGHCERQLPDPTLPSRQSRSSANLGQSFVRRLGSGADCTAIVRAVTTFGANLSMAISAEGVGTQRQFDRLAGIGCTEVQGFPVQPCRSGRCGHGQAADDVRACPCTAAVRREQTGRGGGARTGLATTTRLNGSVSGCG
jgi:hypothetical protein